jgi:hypothetical protein
MWETLGVPHISILKLGGSFVLGKLGTSTDAILVKACTSSCWVVALNVIGRVQ